MIAGIHLACNYGDHHARRTCRISMNGYIEKLLMKYGHSRPSKSQISLHKHHEVKYGAREQLTHEEDNIPALDKYGTKNIQGIVGYLLYYARSVDNKLPVGLSSNGVQQATVT